MVKIVQEISVVALGGVLGATLRLLLGGLPLLGYQSLLLVNLLGAFLAGALLARVTSRSKRLFIGTGILGGFTTTSALAVTAISEVNTSPYFSVLYLATTFYGGLLLFRCAEKLANHA